MKIAVCFRGYLRHWNVTHSNWKKFFDKYDADVFIHTWDTDDLKDTDDVIDLKSGVIEGGVLDIEQVKKLYNPKSIVTETYKNFHDRFVKESEWLVHNKELYLQKYPEHYWIHYTRYVPMMSVFYKWLQVSLLKQEYEKQNDFVYDIVLHSRSDFLIEESFVLEKTNDIVTGPWPNTQHTQHWVDYQKGINDLWMYGPSDKMDLMSNIYLRLNEIWDFCMNTDGYGFFEASNIHTLPITNIKLQGIDRFVKTNNQHGQLVR